MNVQDGMYIPINIIDYPDKIVPGIEDECAHLSDRVKPYKRKD